MSGCAQLKDVSSITGLTKAFSTQIEVAPAYLETIATDYNTTSNEYQFLTGRSCDTLRTPGILDFRAIPLSRKVKGELITLTYSEYEQQRFIVKSQALDFLNKYAQRIKIDKAAENITTFAGYANTGADITDSIPVFGAQAAPYTAAAREIVAVINRYANDFSAAAMVEYRQKIRRETKNHGRANQKGLRHHKCRCQNLSVSLERMSGRKNQSDA